MWEQQTKKRGALRQIVLPLISLISISMAITWWLSSPDQRREYLAWMGWAEPESGPEERPLPEIGVRSTTHDLRPTAICRAPTRDTGDVDVQPVHRWRGPDGAWVFSDRPQAGSQAENISDRFRASEQFARVQVSGEGSRFPQQVRSVIGTDVEQMSRVLRDALDLPVRQINLDIVLYGDRTAFRAASSNPDTLSRGVQGFYQHGANRVAILEQPGFESTRRIARHEASHAMLAGMYGLTPLWLNEGLAEVMTRIEVTGQLRELTPHPAHVAQLRRQFKAATPGALATLLRHDHGSWRMHPSPVTYSRAWGLVYMLMLDSAGRDFLRAVFAAQEAAPCRAIDSMALVEAHYPGGMSSLEAQWRQRGRNGNWGAGLRF